MYMTLDHGQTFTELRLEKISTHTHTHKVRKQHIHTHTHTEHLHYCVVFGRACPPVSCRPGSGRSTDQTVTTGTDSSEVFSA